VKRGYVEKRDKEGVKRDFRILELKNDSIRKLVEQENTGAEKSKMFPTDLGLVVTDFLKQYFDDIMDYNFTARIEEEFDEVAQGKMQWNKMIDDSIFPSRRTWTRRSRLQKGSAGKGTWASIRRAEKKVITRMGRYGPMVQIGDSSNEEEKPRFAKLKNTQSIETITSMRPWNCSACPATWASSKDGRGGEHRSFRPLYRTRQEILFAG